MNRELLKQALDALENDAMQRTFAGGVRISNAAIALRAALAEPAAPQSEAVHESRPATEDDMKVYQAIADNYYRTAAPSVPAGWRLVPVEPTEAHLNSIAMRHHHGFGLLPPEQRENVRAFARQMYEECTGQGFYKLDAAPQAKPVQQWRLRDSVLWSDDHPASNSGPLEYETRVLWTAPTAAPAAPSGEGVK